MVYVSTCAGRRHEKSEDAVLVGREVLSGTTGVFPVPEYGFVCIADGVGGNPGGAAASHFVLESLAKAENVDKNDLRSILVSINRSLIDHAAADRTSYKMATTLTGLFFDPGEPALFHVGNTRAYVRQGRYLKQVTSDHTTYNLLMSSGQREAAEACNKSEITNCFGGSDPSLLSKLYVAGFRRFSLVLMTSDGVHDFVDLDTIEEIIDSESPFEEKCKEIVDRAVAAGSEDDLSAVIIRTPDE